MLLRSIRAELMKCRRSPVWLAFVVLPLFPAILGTVNYLGNLEVLKSQWYSLWTQHSWGCSAPGSGGWSTRTTTGIRP